MKLHPLVLKSSPKGKIFNMAKKKRRKVVVVLWSVGAKEKQKVFDRPIDAKRFADKLKAKGVLVRVMRQMMGVPENIPDLKRGQMPKFITHALTRNKRVKVNAKMWKVALKDARGRKHLKVGDIGYLQWYEEGTVEQIAVSVYAYMYYRATSMFGSKRLGGFPLDSSARSEWRKITCKTPLT
ncbi:MAG TPA: hypothetical protein ENI27_03680 [bacterium]|nr:hypothetical protein [bacterium]